MSQPRKPAMPPLVRVLMLSLALAHAAAFGFDKQEGQKKIAAFAQAFDAEQFEKNDGRPEMGWFIQEGPKACDYVKDTFNNSKDPRTRQAALFMYCRNWPELGDERLEKALKSREESTRVYAERLRAFLSAERRRMSVQIVDDPRLIAECAILEGKPYKYFLKLAAATTESKLDERKDEKVTVEQLKGQSNQFRGRVITRHGVVIEAAIAPLPDEYGLPGWTVIPALFVSETRELYELRIVCPPGHGEKLLQKLVEGINEGKNPVLRVSGYFMKCHTKNSALKNDGPWREPLLIAPEPSFPKLGWIKNAGQELEESGYDKYLPSVAIQAPKAEERLVIDIVPGTTSNARLRIYGKDAPLGDAAFVAAAIEAFKKTLPADQADQVSVVVVKTVGSPSAVVTKAMETVKAAGVTRAYHFDESQVLIEKHPPSDQK